MPLWLCMAACSSDTRGELDTIVACPMSVSGSFQPETTQEWADCCIVLR